MKLCSKNATRLFFSIPGFIALVILAFGYCISHKMDTKHTTLGNDRTRPMASFFRIGTSRTSAERTASSMWRPIRQVIGFGLIGNGVASDPGCPWRYYEDSRCTTIKYQLIENKEAQTKARQPDMFVDVAYEHTTLGYVSRGWAVSTSD